MRVVRRFLQVALVILFVVGVSNDMKGNCLLLVIINALLVLLAILLEDREWKRKK